MHEELALTSGEAGRGVKPAGFVVLRTSHCPAVLVELGFLSHGPSRARLARDSYQRKLADCIARGMDHYVKSEFPTAK